MKYIFRSLLFIFPFLIHCTSILVTDEARKTLDQLAEFQSTNLCA